jgi:integrase
MPRQELMSWDDKQARWTKMYRGKRYTVAASILGPFGGKIDSLQAANAWWTAKRAELDGQRQPGSGKAIREVMAEYSGHAITDEDEEEQTRRDFISEFMGGKAIPDEFLSKLLPEKTSTKIKANVEYLLQSVFSDKDVGQTLGDHFDSWKAIQLALGTSAARKKMNIHMATFFLDFVGAATPVSAINETTWESFWTHLSGIEGLSGGYKKRIQATARMLIETMVERKALALPGNLYSKLLVFRKSPTTPNPSDMPTITRLLALVHGQTRLHVFLMLNTGMLPKDISEMRHEMIDWKAGTITRKRTKLKDCESAPTVTYRLWPETMELLRQWRSKHPEFVLVTKSGKPWVVNEITSATYKNSNSIASCFRNFTTASVDGKATRLIDISPKQLRTTGSTFLAKHEQYKFYVVHYLADSPKGTANKDYVVPSQTEFDKAIKWLGDVVTGKVAAPSL